MTPAAETEERQQEMTPAAEIGGRQQESTAAAESGESEQFTTAAEIGGAQQFTAGAENGEAQQFTPAAENEEQQQEFTPTVEIGETQKGGEHNQIDGLPHENSENLIDEISEVPLIGFVNDTSVTFIDLPVAATETARESHTTDESDDDSDSETEFRITKSKNNKPKRPNLEVCLLCMKEVKRMRDHLTNKHTIGTENKYASLFRLITAHSKPIVATNVQFALPDLAIVGSIPKTTPLNAFMIERMLI